MSTTELTTPAVLDLERGRLAEMDAGSLRRELADALSLTVKALMRAAMIVRELESRGEDLDELKLSLLPNLRLIACGQLAPEAVVRFVGAPMVMSAVGRLPIDEQRRLGEGEPVAMAVRAEDGSITHRLVDPLHLPRKQVGQVFGPGRIRPLAEQIVILESERAARKAPPRPKSGVVEVDRRNRRLRVAGKAVEVADVLAALAEMSGPTGDAPDDDGEPDVPVAVRMKPHEHARIKAMAAEAHVSMGELIRRALAAGGLL